MSILVEIAANRHRSERSLAVNRKDGSVMVWIPGGEFEMGDGKDKDCPKHRVVLGGYWIGVYCVTNQQYARFVGETRYGTPDGWKWREVRYREHPVVGVSWEDAVGYGKWAGCELPTEAEWERAARGPRGLIYPWGAEWEEGKCRNAKNRGSEEMAEVWSYGVGTSGWGTYQQSGNLHEWCADWYDKGYYGNGGGKSPTGTPTGSYRVIRGGNWRHDDPSSFRGAHRGWNDPSRGIDGLGFRLVRRAA